jgi:uncharacterized membrane protein YbjE (DUF340 family)
MVQLHLRFTVCYQFHPPPSRNFMPSVYSLVAEIDQEVGNQKKSIQVCLCFLRPWAIGHIIRPSLRFASRRTNHTLRYAVFHGHFLSDPFCTNRKCEVTLVLVVLILHVASWETSCYFLTVELLDVQVFTIWREVCVCGSLSVLILKTERQIHVEHSISGRSVFSRQHRVHIGPLARPAFIKWVLE